MQVLTEGRGTGWEHIYFIVEYETARDGTKVGIRYKIKWTIDSGYWFGYNINANVWTEGTNYGRQIKANTPNKGSGEALFPDKGGYYWFDKGFSDNDINCRVVINSTNGGTINLDSGEDQTLTAPTGYVVSSIKDNIDFIVGNDLNIKINDITNQNYTYQLTAKILDDDKNWVTIKTLTTTNKEFSLGLSSVASMIYSEVTTKNSTQFKIDLETLINGTSLGYTTKEGICYITNSNPTALTVSVTNMEEQAITELTTGYGPYNNQSNILVRITKLANSAGINSATLTKAIILVGNTKREIAISELIGTGTKDNEFISAFSDTVDNELIDGKGYVAVTVVDSRGNSTVTKIGLTISRYVPAYFTKLELRRDNNIDQATRLIGEGISQPVGTNNTNNKPWITYTIPNGDPCEVDKSYVTYDYNTNKFTVNAPMQGDLGASGFTQNQEFEVEVTLGDYISQIAPAYCVAYVRNGKTLMHYGKTGIAFGELYDENEGGSCQVGGKRLLSGECVLYENSSGTNSTVTLSETSANFEYIEIFFRNNDNVFSGVKVNNPNGKNICLISNSVTSGIIYGKEKTVEINGVSISSVGYAEYSFGPSGYTYLGNNNYIYITKVVGFKEV